MDRKIFLENVILSKRRRRKNVVDNVRSLETKKKRNWIQQRHTKKKRFETNVLIQMIFRENDFVL